MSERNHPTALDFGLVDRPTGLNRVARAAWKALGASTDTGARFDRDLVEAPPEPVRRWLLRTIRNGAPLLRSARLAMTGEIRLRGWTPFRAVQVLAPPRGLVWAATAGSGLMSIRGFDRYSDATGEMRWRLLGLIPVMTAADADTSRSAAGRLASEALLIPAAALAPWVRWRPVSTHRARADVTFDGLTHTLTVDFTAEGALAAISLPRWGDPLKRGYAEHTFGVTFEGERRFGRQTFPHAIEAGWWTEPERSESEVFFRATLDHAELF